MSSLFCFEHKLAIYYVYKEDVSKLYMSILF